MVDKEHSGIMKEVSVAQIKLLKFTHALQNLPNLGEELLEIQRTVPETPGRNM